MSNNTAVDFMGQTDHERRHLALQAAVLNPFTGGFLRRGGISAGCKCSNWAAASAKFHYSPQDLSAYMTV